MIRFLTLLFFLGYLNIPLGCADSSDKSTDIQEIDVSGTDADAPSPVDTYVPPEPEDVLADIVYPTMDLEEAVQRFDAGSLTRSLFLKILESNMDSPPPTTLDPSISESLYFPAGTYEFMEDTTIESQVVVVLDEGVQWKLHPGITLTIEGRILALGSSEAPIDIRGVDNELYSRIISKGGPNLLEYVHVSYGERLIQIEGESGHQITHCAFDAWTVLGLDLLSAKGVVIAQSSFALNTEEGFVLGEAIHGVNSPVRIEDSSFGFISGYRDAIDLGDCYLPDIPVLARNHFMGGEDDAIDLDDCTAVVVANRIEGYRPLDLTLEGQKMNGGGITGSGSSKPLLVNNVIRNCYHGIGFKDGAQPLLLHNTIADCHVGITLYQSNAGQSPPHGTLFNNIIWNNRDWFDDKVQDVLLHGRWWPTYSQEAGDQATLEAGYNLVTEALDGTENESGDPLLTWQEGYPIPSENSPAIDSALSNNLPVGAFDPQGTWVFLETDLLGQPRPHEDGDFLAPDRGAVELQP